MGYEISTSPVLQAVQGIILESGKLVRFATRPSIAMEIAVSRATELQVDRGSANISLRLTFVALEPLMEQIGNRIAAEALGG